MRRQLQILIVDDSPEDADLVHRELTRAGYDVRARRVETSNDTIDALADGAYHLALCAYALPGFDALALIRRLAPGLPVFVLAGAIGEERAVECLHAGARELILKDGLARLVQAVEREIAPPARATEPPRSATKSKPAEAGLDGAGHLQVLGRMAAGLSHDLKNLLNPLSLYLDLAERALARNDVERARTNIGELRNVIKRGVEVVDRLRVFSRPANELPALRIDLDTVAREAVMLAKTKLRAASRGVTISVDPGGPYFVRADPGELVGAVVNLVANGVDALTDGGTVQVRTGRDQGAPWLEVIDDGVGMSAEIQNKALEPFFTTKGDKGSGLGLAMVHATILRCRGTVSLSSEPGKGTRVRLTFPPEGSIPA